MKKIFNNLIGSFDNTQNSGFSARKLTAFAVVCMYAYCHKFVTVEILEGVLIIDGLFIAFLLGLVTAEQIIKYKNGNTTTPTAQPATADQI
jgi:hypothetical protein